MTSGYLQMSFILRQGLRCESLQPTLFTLGGTSPLVPIQELWAAFHSILHRAALCHPERLPHVMSVTLLGATSMLFWPFYSPGKTTRGRSMGQTTITTPGLEAATKSHRLCPLLSILDSSHLEPTSLLF